MVLHFTAAITCNTCVACSEMAGWLVLSWDKPGYLIGSVLKITWRMPIKPVTSDLDPSSFSL